jgi:hypothetical protein
LEEICVIFLLKWNGCHEFVDPYGFQCLLMALFGLWCLGNDHLTWKDVCVTSTQVYVTSTQVYVPSTQVYVPSVSGCPGRFLVWPIFMSKITHDLQTLLKRIWVKTSLPNTPLPYHPHFQNTSYQNATNKYWNNIWKMKFETTNVFNTSNLIFLSNYAYKCKKMKNK